MADFNTIASNAGLTLAERNRLRDWLTEQLIAQVNAKLEQGGHTQHHVPLRTVFIDLPVQTEALRHRVERPKFLQHLLKAQPANLASLLTRRGTGLQRGRSATDTDTTFALNLLIGGPGQGKSTLSQLAAQLNRAALLKGVRDELNHAQRHAVESFYPKTEQEEQLWPTEGCLPLQIVLPELSAWLASAREPENEFPSVLAYLKSRASTGHHGLDIKTLVRFFEHIPLLLVFDGFDEVGAAEDRKNVVFAIRELLQWLASKELSAQVIATTRPQGYSGELESLGIPLRKHFLLPLHKNEALGYAKKLIDAKIDGIDERTKLAAKIQEAANDSATARLLSTPLQVTILTALVQQIGRAPRERWNLFHRYFAFTYDREIERETYASPLLATYRSQIETIHTRVGLILQIEAERTGGASARMPRQRLVSVISDVLAEDGFDALDQEELTNQIANAAENRLVFLVEPEPNFFGFEIRSLQEFMAAWALTTGGDSYIEARLRAISKSAIFRNVLLFAVSRLLSTNSPLRDELLKIIEAAEVYEETIPAGLSAQLALEILEEGAVQSQPRRARDVMRYASRLLDIPEAEYAKKLAQLSTPDTILILLEEIESRILSLGTRVTLVATWATLLHCACTHPESAKPIVLRNWHRIPEINSVLRLFSQATPELKPWLAELIEMNADRVDPNLFASFRIERTNNLTWPEWIALTISKIRERRLRTTYSPITFIDEPVEIPISPAEPPPQTWASVIAHIRFEAVPTAANLVEFVRVNRASPVDLHAIFDRSIMTWPIDVAIDVLKWDKSTDELITKLESGQLGDLALWLEAQARWRELDILLQLPRSLEHPWKDWLNNPPLLALPNWIATETVDRGQKLYVRLRKLFVIAPADSLKRWCARTCFFSLRGIKRATVKYSEIEEMAEYVDDAMFILCPRPKAVTEEDWFRLLEKTRPSTKGENDWAMTPEAVLSNAHRDGAVPNELIRWSYTSINKEMLDYGGRDDDSQLAGYYSEIVDRCSPELQKEAAIIKVYLGTATDQDLNDLRDVLDDPMQGAKYAYHVVHAVRARTSELDLRPLLRAAVARIGENIELLCDALAELRWLDGANSSGIATEKSLDYLSLPASGASEHFRWKNDTIGWLSSIQLQNIGRFANLSVTLSKPKRNSGQWTVILGRNGAGKTTILRSLVLALRNLRQPSIWPASTFLREWTNCNSSSKVSTITAILNGQNMGERYTTHITKRAQDYVYAQNPPLNSPRVIPIFAYGCRRGSALGGPERAVDFSDGQEIATLMDDSANLIHAETWLKVLEGDSQRNPVSEQILRAIFAALCTLLNVKSIEIKNKALWVTENDGTHIPFTELSDGFLTSAGWFLDLIARWLNWQEVRGEEIHLDFLQRMSGLVVIDEIDLHIHPSIQMEIISRTRKLLPRMSFIVTTHNPLTLVGASANEIWVLEDSEDGPELRPGHDSPLLLSGGQIYRRYFGIADIYPTDVGRDMNRYMFLCGLPELTEAETNERNEIRDRLIKEGVPKDYLDEMAQIEVQS